MSHESQSICDVNTNSVCILHNYGTVIITRCMSPCVHRALFFGAHCDKTFVIIYFYFLFTLFFKCCTFKTNWKISKQTDCFGFAGPFHTYKAQNKFTSLVTQWQKETCHHLCTCCWEQETLTSDGSGEGEKNVQIFVHNFCLCLAVKKNKNLQWKTSILVIFLGYFHHQSRQEWNGIIRTICPSAHLVSIWI